MGAKFGMTGTPETNRTSDLPLRRGLLYPLSYRGPGNNAPFYAIPAPIRAVAHGQVRAQFVDFVR